MRAYLTFEEPKGQTCRRRAQQDMGGINGRSVYTFDMGSTFIFLNKININLYEQHMYEHEKVKYGIPSIDVGCGVVWLG